MLTDSQRQEYHAALEKCLGDKTAAAQVLGLPLNVFRTRLYNCKSLRDIWCKKRKSESAPSEVEIANRTALVPAEKLAVEPIQTTESIEALALAADARLKSGIENLSESILTVDEKALAASLHSFQLRHAGAAAEVIHGSVSVTAIKMTKALNDLVAEYSRLAEGGQGPRNEAGGEKNEASLILEAIPKFAAELRKLSEVVGKANLNRALLALKAKQDAAGPTKRGKPGFGTKQPQVPSVAIQAQAGSIVNLGGQDAQK